MKREFNLDGSCTSKWIKNKKTGQNNHDPQANEQDWIRPQSPLNLLTNMFTIKFAISNPKISDFFDICTFSCSFSKLFNINFLFETLNTLLVALTAYTSYYYHKFHIRETAIFIKF